MSEKDINYNISFGDDQRLIVEIPGKVVVHLAPGDDGLSVEVFGAEGAKYPPVTSTCVTWNAFPDMSEATAALAMFEHCTKAEALLRAYPEKAGDIYETFWKKTAPYRNVLPFEGIDPDTTYEEDVRACISAFLSYVDESKVIDVGPGVFERAVQIQLEPVVD